MATAPTIAVIAPGAMGAAVASRFTKAGCTVLTTLLGRSASTVERAKKAGMQDASLGDIARRADWVLSIIPPSSALAFAEQFKKAYETSGGNPKLSFADCNAVSPDTVKSIARVFDGSNIRFVDASIIGGPPTDGYDPAFYASAAPEDADILDGFVGLSAWGLRAIALKGEGAGVGDASALKMSYAVSAYLNVCGKCAFGQFPAPTFGTILRRGTGGAGGRIQQVCRIFVEAREGFLLSLGSGIPTLETDIEARLSADGLKRLPCSSKLVLGKLVDLYPSLEPLCFRNASGLIVCLVTSEGDAYLAPG